jgi:hypothetical protein
MTPKHVFLNVSIATSIVVAGIPTAALGVTLTDIGLLPGGTSCSGVANSQEIATTSNSCAKYKNANGLVSDAETAARQNTKATRVLEQGHTEIDSAGDQQ